MGHGLPNSYKGGKARHNFSLACHHTIGPRHMIVPITPQHAAYVCANLSDWVLRDVSAAHLLGDHEKFTEILCAEIDNSIGYGYALTRDGVPIGVGGVEPLHRGVMYLWALHTDRYKEAEHEYARVARRAIAHVLSLPTCHRVQLVTAAERDQSHRWLKMVGLKYESTLVKFGRNGEDYHMYAGVN